MGRHASFCGKKTGVCVGFAPSHSDLRRFFSLGEDVRRFPARGRLLLWFAGLPDVPGSLRGFLGLLSGCASFREAVRRSRRLCMEFSFSQQASRRFPLWKPGGVVHARLCVEVPVAP
ncbi:hypothetical protein NDU88_008361 [Pleurodeles waltl]|uniref:Uncharacterized protein n=1 Tax=Pleurodeles waltl TaxID=8319 RepID=A0AAV7QUF0_PLEWA|nr:hypothetical protein NDU88_008361 [Pleurodeles waltl]